MDKNTAAAAFATPAAQAQRIGAVEDLVPAAFATPPAAPRVRAFFEHYWMHWLALALALSLATLAAAAPLSAQNFPARPIRMVVAYPPGGATDITSRLFGEQFKNQLGQSFVVENKSGAFGIIAIEEMARSKPDGYTLFVGNVSTNAITPVLFKNKFKIDFEKDVVPVSRLAIYPSFLMVTTTNFDVKDVKGLVDYAKKNPGKVRYSSAGVGSFPHFDMEIFARRASVDMIHIPNKTGAAGMVNDLVVGDAQVGIINSASTAAMIKAGKMKPIAVAAEQRILLTRRDSAPTHGLTVGIGQHAMQVAQQAHRILAAIILQ